MILKSIIKIMDAYRSFARRHPVCFTGINLIFTCLWGYLIMFFSGEDAEESGSRSAEILVKIVNAVAPSADITLENYNSFAALENMERVIRKMAHMTEYGVLAALVWATLFGFAALSRKLAYLIPVLCVIILGTCDEINQTTVSGREGSWIDVAIDAAGAVIAVYIIYRLTLFYRRMKSNRHFS